MHSKLTSKISRLTLTPKEKEEQEKEKEKQQKKKAADKLANHEGASVAAGKRMGEVLGNIMVVTEDQLRNKWRAQALNHL